MRVIGVTILAVACSALLSACGQKGPLVLPPPIPASPQSKAPEARPDDRPFPDVPATDEKK
jgi:predicted small lipoprotein YifL